MAAFTACDLGRVASAHSFALGFAESIAHDDEAKGSHFLTGDSAPQSLHTRCEVDCRI
jgi:hypothetical protein